MKTILSIAGADPSGGAGLLADIKTFSAHRLFGLGVVVSVVAENTRRVISICDVPPRYIKDQLTAVFEDIEVAAVKIGMLSRAESMLAVEEKLLEHRPPFVVLDPVMYAKNGAPLMEPRAMDVLRDRIAPLVNFITPNIPEAEMMTGLAVAGVGDMEKAARLIHRLGCANVIVKGGHLSGEALDILYDGREFHYFSEKRIETKNTHGTGCAFSAALASNLALGFSPLEATRRAKRYITTAIEHSLDIGRGHGPTHHFYDLYQAAERGQKERACDL